MRIKFVISMFLAALAATAQTRMSVDSCMRYAANHNLDVRAARISLSDSRLDQQSALASTLPSVGAQIGAQFSFGRSIDPATNTYNNLRTFGNSYGLSYSTFEYSDATLSKSEIGVSESLKASVTVTNNGPYDGDDVVQLYIRDEYGSVTRPVKELKAFRRISLKNGESTKVEFDITPEMLQCWGVSEKWSVEPGDFTILLGSSSSDSDLTPLPLKVK